jgi:uncharacterized protein (DUF58 family)
MKTAPFVVDKELLKRRRFWYVLALSLFLLSLLSREPLFFLASLFTLLLAVLPELWYRFALRRLVVRQSVDQTHLFFGEEVTLSVSIENRKWLPLPWLTVEDKITPPLTVLKKRALRIRATNQDFLSSVWLLWSYQRVTRRYHMRCQTRGLHTFGPVTLNASDPFGWLESDMVLPANASVLVYPLIAPLDMLGFPSVHPLGEQATPLRLLEDPLRVVGVRDYELGDDPRRIHWKASAHAGKLQSKVYESSTLRRLLILLDTWNYRETDKRAKQGITGGMDVEMQEFAITTAASLAVWGLEEGYVVGLLANCALKFFPDEIPMSREVVLQDEEISVDAPIPRDISFPIVRVPCSPDPNQHERLLSTFARLVPEYTSSLDLLLYTEEQMFPTGTIIVLVSAASSLREETTERLYELERRGVSSHLVLLGDAKEQVETYGLPVYYPGGKEQWYELLRHTGDATNGFIGTSETPLQLG